MPKKEAAEGHGADINRGGVPRQHAVALKKHSAVRGGSGSILSGVVKFACKVKVEALDARRGSLRRRAATQAVVSKASTACCDARVHEAGVVMNAKTTRDKIVSGRNEAVGRRCVGAPRCRSAGADLASVA
jgi:hypothetical protein